MLIYGFLLILLLRPSWGLLNFFVLVAVALWSVSAIGLLQTQPPIVVGIAVFIQGSIFYGIGAAIVGLSGWLKSRKSAAEKRAEKLVEEARAEATARGQGGND